MNNVEIAQALFAAFTRGDEDAVRNLCAADMQAIQNYGKPMSLDALIRFSLAVHQLVENFRYEDAIRTDTADGFVEEHLVRGTLPDGSELRLAACVIAQVSQGKISQLREYLDGAAAVDLIEALSQSQTSR